MSFVGQRSTVDVGSVAHGGHCVARITDGDLAGVVVFVRHALPGERVVVEITDGEEGDRFLRGDAIEVLQASPDRVEAPCKYARPGGCGGCDFQHASLPAQRRLKAAVVEEQLRRLAKIDRTVEVEAVPGDEEGLHWRTRIQYAVGPDAVAGLRRHRSHDVIGIEECLLAHPDLPKVNDKEWNRAKSVEAIVSNTGEQLVIVEPNTIRPPELHERVGDDVYQVTGSGFWQVHPGAAPTLRQAVLDGLEAQPGESVADLYAGVGLFAKALAHAVGPTGRVHAVELDADTLDDAKANLRAERNVILYKGRVERILATTMNDVHLDLVVLDPPRAGAKKPVVQAIVEARPRRVVYVACDPAALARDVALFAERGYELVSLRAFDQFPMTHHVECVAVLAPATNNG
jgi:tRNA/tmRNA/rRNA uracil-C5-methylase (TrmA/RlmC/RlmD family)